MADIEQAVWAKAAERLNNVGVFADERHQFSSSLFIKQFDNKVRNEGYVGGPLEFGELDHPKNDVSFLIFDKNKMSDVDAAVLAWDQEYRIRWHKIVEDRVSDWLARLDKLQAMIHGWLPATMSIVPRDPLRMHEELMAKFGVPPTPVPTFDILKGVERVMRVQPKGLWIIGANGRVDLITPTASYILVDRSPPGDGNPNWHYYSPNNKRQPVSLDKTSFIDLLK